MGSFHSTGNDWKAKIYFDENAEQQEPGTEYNAKELQSKLRQIIDNRTQNVILNVYLYKVPLSEWLPVPVPEMGIMYHSFVVLESECRDEIVKYLWYKKCKWWWSLEKHADTITLQRSKYKPAVVESCKKERRLKQIYQRPMLVISDKAKDNFYLQDLIDYIYQTNELDLKYCVDDNNCQKFAKTIFDKVAAKKTWEWTYFEPILVVNRFIKKPYSLLIYIVSGILNFRCS